MSLSEKLRCATGQLEDKTAEIAEFSATSTGQIVFLRNGPDAVFLDGENPTYFGNVEVMDTEGDVYTVEIDAFDEAYDCLGHTQGITVFASKALGNKASQNQAYARMIAPLLNEPRDETNTALIALITKENLPLAIRESQMGMEQGARDDCNFASANAAPVRRAA